MITLNNKIPLILTSPNPKPTPNLQLPIAFVSFTNREMDYFRKLSKGCFKVFSSSSKKDRKIEIESVNGGEDVFDAEVAGDNRVQPDHLVVMVNGIIGSASDWRYAGEQFVKSLPDRVIVHRSECNSSMLTFDGVDRMGERLAEEVLNVVERWEGVSKISFVAHSLGGLVSRYAIARLYKVSDRIKSSDHCPNYTNKETNFAASQHEHIPRETIGGLEPMNFVTFATPHLGVRGNKQLPLLCGLPFLEKSASQTAHWVAGRSGKHLFLTDSDSGRPPLLLRMVKDSDDLPFMSALRSFKRRVAYANANYDHVVGWRTSSIRRQNELPNSNLLMSDPKYPHIVHIELETGEERARKASFSKIGTQVIDLEEEMIRGLNQVSWERVDVSFHKSKQRYVAHNTIQVKTYWLNSDGADVVQHMIDNFLL